MAATPSLREWNLLGSAQADPRPCGAPTLRSGVQNAGAFCEPPSVVQSRIAGKKIGAQEGPYIFLVVMGGIEPPTCGL